MTTEFVWPVSKSGYQVVRVPEPNSSIHREIEWIAPSVPGERTRRTGDPWCRSAPLQSQPALFRTFADLTPEPQCLVQFANKFGVLTNPAEGESVKTWQTAVAEMRSAVEACARADARYEFLQAVSFAANSREGADVEFVLSSGNAPAMIEVQQKLNENVVHARPLFTSGLGELCIRIMPTTLLEAMWLQFGLAVEAKKSFRRCRDCDSWFEISRNAARIDRVFCSEACKAKAYRRRSKRRVESVLREHETERT